MGKGKLTEGKIGLRLFKMSVPMFFGLIGFALFNFFDTKFVGELGEKPLAAISYTVITMLVMFALAFGLGTGITASIGKAIGEQDELKVKRLTTSGLILAIILGIFLSLIGFPTITPLFKLFGATNELLPYIFDYMELWYIGVPLIIIPIIGNSAIRAQGNTLIPAVIMGVCIIANIILDYGLIFGNLGMPRLEVFGASLATFISRFMTLVASLGFLHFKFKMISFKNFSVKIMIESWREILKIGLPAIGTQMVIPLAVALVTKLASEMEYPEQLVSTLQVASRVDFFAIAVIASLGSVLVPFIAQNFGSKKYNRIKQALKISRWFTLIWGTIMTLFFLYIHDDIGPAFMKEDQGEMFLQYMSEFYLLVPFTFVFRMLYIVETSSLNALQKPLITSVLTFVQMIIVYYPLAWGLSMFFGYKGIFYAFTIATILGGIVAVILNNNVLKPLGKLTSEKQQQ